MDWIVCQVFLCISILSQHFHQINQQQRTVVLHGIANISGLSDSSKEVD